MDSPWHGEPGPECHQEIQPRAEADEIEDKQQCLSEVSVLRGSHPQHRTTDLQEGPEADSITQAGLAAPGRARTGFLVPHEKAAQWDLCTRLPSQHQSPQGSVAA